MKIGIIGAGNIGGNLTRRLTALGHEVSVANSRGPETLADLAKETGATPVTVTEAARGAEVVVVTIPLKNVAELPVGLFDGAAKDFVLIETGNYYPKRRDGRIAEIEDEGLTESRWSERHLGHPVVKAFNGTYAQDILDRHRPAGAPDRMALPIAGDDEAAKQAVRALVDELGFDTVDAGGLDDSWRQQPGTPVYGLRRAPAPSRRPSPRPPRCARRSSRADRPRRARAVPRARGRGLRRRLSAGAPPPGRSPGLGQGPGNARPGLSTADPASGPGRRLRPGLRPGLRLRRPAASAPRGPRPSAATEGWGPRPPAPRRSPGLGQGPGVRPG